MKRSLTTMSLDDLPKDGEIGDDEWKIGSGKCRKGAYKTKKHVFNTLDECINESYFSLSAHLKGYVKKTKKHYSKAQLEDNAPNSVPRVN